MTRKRIKHQLIPDESKRDITFRKRADGLLKKANELSILCGVDIGVIVHKQSGENNAIVWPSPPVVKDRVEKFLNFSDLERRRKMVTGVKLLEQRMATEAESLSKSKKRIEEMESQKLMNEVTQAGESLNELGLYQLNTLNSFADDMLKKLEKRKNEFNEQAMMVIPPPSTSAMVAAAQQNIGGAGPSSVWNVRR